ncbi:hypothetical protein MSPP1_002321 [Malassezia sp. CBS 17886]|nr:hypothetical protein MSPP1_002321 [Malassezia sp. CBS 17886]
MPRAFVAQLAARPILGDKKSQHTPLELFVLRCQACQQNSYENLPIFFVVLLAGIIAKLPGGYLNRATALYILLRVIYTFVYVTVSSRRLAILRSVSFAAQTLLYCKLMLDAAYVLK